MTPTLLRPTRPAGLPLAELAPGASGRITGISLDSRQVQPGDLYVALPGQKTHGAAFAAQAVASGARAVFTDAAGATQAGECGVPVVVADDPRAAMGPLAARIYGDPAAGLATFAVTGTNGKTSTVFLLEAGLAALGRRVATIGTIGFRLAGEPLETARGTVTTPDAPDLQGMLGYLAEHGADTVAMEVSSHALALDRVAGLTFDVAGFTMFGQDHLDFHPTLEDYFAAKARLFLDGRSRVAVINVDDPAGRRLAGLVRADGRARLVTTGVHTEDADYRVLGFDVAADGSADVRLRLPDGAELAYRLSMLGDFNVFNSLTALAMIGAAGLDVPTAAGGLASAQVPGRMQRVDLGPGRPHVVVDFAHTPQAVTAALRALPAGGRHVAVLGAGGDRDHSKRPLMGAAAAEAADLVVVTDDNPRTEEPSAIRAAVLAGARDTGAAEVVDGGDRRAAITAALDAAGPGDWVAILGKGHEKGQIIGAETVPFDDVQVVRDWAEGR